MKEEKTVSLKETIIFLIGNKWLYLIMFISFLAISLVSFNIVSSSKREYSCFFECNLPGFHFDREQEKGYFADGRKFEPNSLIEKNKIEGYLSVSYLFDGLTYDEITNKCGIKSFKYKELYKNGEDSSEDNKTLDKQGYEIVFNASVINIDQAKLFSEMIVNEIVKKSNSAVENLCNSNYLNLFEKGISYEAKINCLSDEFEYLNSLINFLKTSFDNFKIEADNYGGSDEKNYLPEQSADDWETQMKADLESFNKDSLLNEVKVNGYIDSNYPEYINFVETEVKSLNRTIGVEEGILAQLEAQRDNLVTLSGSDESAHISVYNEKIISLTEKIANQKEQVSLYNLQLEKLDPSFIASPEYAAYSANLSAFENKLNSFNEKLNFYTVQFEAIAKKTAKNNSRIYFDDLNVVSIRAGMGNFAILVYSLLIATFLPMAINGGVAAFKAIESKPLFKIKSKQK